MKRLALAAVLLSTAMGWAKLSPLSPAPDWSKLNIFQQSITRGDFLSLLDKIYAPNGAWQNTITVDADSAIIQTQPGGVPFLLHFAPSPAEAKKFSKFWRSRSQLPAEEPGKPLASLKIALDPGHLGGKWAKMEERWFQIGKSTPVTEGDMTLRVAKMIQTRLEALGAQVFLTRSKAEPVTTLRPNQLRKAAVASLVDKKAAVNAKAVEKESEKLFYRVSEIHRRARLVNEVIQPDLVICLHFNAEEWGNEKRPTLVDVNHLHFLVSGNLSADELAYEDERYDMLVKLLNRSVTEELPVSNALAKSMETATGLPPFVYVQNNAIRIDANPYIWARNLLANRLFLCPVVYVEPYVMNSHLVFARIQAGDYEGMKVFGGVERKSIYREYADAIVEGLVAYYSRRSL